MRTRASIPKPAGCDAISWLCALALAMISDRGSMPTTEWAEALSEEDELFKINVELDWFERHGMGRPYEWIEAPPSGDEEEDDEEGEGADY